MGKIFVNYRRDDVPGDARGLRDGLAAKFGKSNVFMDVDNLLVGQRFDVELAKALDACDVLIAVIGPRWMDLLRARGTSSERDYVREEIAAALARRIVVIPVRVGREGSMPALPRGDELPADIRDLFLHQKLDVAHERFGRDIAELIEGIVAVRRSMASGDRPSVMRSLPWGWIGASVAGTLAVAYVGAHSIGVPVPWPGRVSDPPGLTPATTAAKVSDPEGLTPTAAKARADEVERKRIAEREAATRAESERIRLANLKLEADAQQNAETGRVAKLEAYAEAARQAVDAKRLADLEVERRRVAAAAEAKRKSDEEASRRVPQPGQTFRDCTDGCPEMVVVPAGTFMMGEGKDQRKTTIQQAFAVGKFEVTFAEWEACVKGGGCASNKNPSDQGWGKGSRPVINVSWNDAKEYVSWLSRKTGMTYRLLTEAEWEYAARAGSTTTYSWGDNIGKGNAVCDGCGSQWDNKQTAPVGSFKPNAFGLHDMHGNVLEWCEDGDASSRVLRGGSWYGGPRILRSAVRYGYQPDFRLDNLGFRVARVLSPSRTL